MERQQDNGTSSSVKSCKWITRSQSSHELLDADVAVPNVDNLLADSGLDFTGPDGGTLLTETIEELHYGAFNLCIKLGAPVNHPVHERWTPLHFAANMDNFYMASELLRNGAYIDPVNSEGDTPLTLAVERRHFWVSKLLLSRGANVNFINIFVDRMPLTTAIGTGDSKMIRLILQHQPMLSLARIQSCYSRKLSVWDSPLVRALRPCPPVPEREPNLPLFIQVLKSSVDYRENFVHELDWALREMYLSSAITLLMYGVKLSSSGQHMVLNTISGKLDPPRFHFASYLVQACPWATYSCSHNFLLEYVLGVFCRNSGDICSVPRNHTVGHCRMAAALLHLGLPMNDLVPLAESGRFNQCECRHWIPSHENPLLKTFNPPSLKSQCRTVIRRVIGYGVSWKMWNLERLMLVSRGLKDYLTFESECLLQILDPNVPAHTLQINRW